MNLGGMFRRGMRGHFVAFGAAPVSIVCCGVYLGLFAPAVLVGFGLAIVITRASTAYVVANSDDDVD